MSFNDSDLPRFGRNLMVESYNKEPKDQNSHPRSKSVFTSPPSRPKISLNSNSKLDRSIEGSPRRSPASVEYQSVSKNYDTVKKYVAQINLIDTHLNYLLDELRKKLGVKENDIATAIKIILQRVDELLEAERQLREKEKEKEKEKDNIRQEPVKSRLENLYESLRDDNEVRSLNQQIEENLKEIASLRTLNEELKGRVKAQEEDGMVESLCMQVQEKVREIESLKASNDELRGLIKASNDVPLVSRIDQENLLKDNAFIFQKASLASLMRGSKLKQEEMASVEKVQIDYKQKRVIVEYNITEGEFVGAKDIVKGDYDMRYSCSAKVLLKSTTKLARKFITTNNFLLCNITDLCRFLEGEGCELSPS